MNKQSIYLLFICIAFLAGCGPKNASECKDEYLEETNFQPGKQVIRKACYLGYEQSQSDDIDKVAICVLSDASELYSKESAFKIIDSCAKKYKSKLAYNKLTSPLLEDIEELEDRLRDIEDRLDD